MPSSPDRAAKRLIPKHPSLPSPPLSHISLLFRPASPPQPTDNTSSSSSSRSHAQNQVLPSHTIILPIARSKSSPPIPHHHPLEKLHTHTTQQLPLPRLGALEAPPPCASYYSYSTNTLLFIDSARRPAQIPSGGGEVGSAASIQRSRHDFRSKNRGRPGDGMVTPKQSRARG